MSFEDYKGSINLGAGLKPSGEGYPLMQTSDIQAEEGGKRLDKLLDEYADRIEGIANKPTENLDEEITAQASLVEQIRTVLQEKMSAVGISSIEKAFTEGLVDTYIITFTDESTSTFTVTNGKSAYKYAKDAGYTGTENEFAEKLAAQDRMVGTWVLRDELDLTTLPEKSEIRFDSNRGKFKSIERQLVSEGIYSLNYRYQHDTLKCIYIDNPSGIDGISHGWQDESYKNLYILQEPDDENIDAWIRANADKPEQQQGTDARLRTKSKRVVDAINELNDKIDEGGADADLSNYQTKTDEGLETESKEVVGAINEVNGKIIISRLKTTLSANNTLSELVEVLRENGITANDSCLIKCGNYPTFSDTVVKISDVFGGSLISITEWYYPSDPINYTASGISASTTIGAIQTARNNLLTTTNKNIAGAINEVNGKTVDKIATIDTSFLGPENFDTDGSIMWKDGFAFLDEDGKLIKHGKIHQKIPICAGENVSFSYDAENNAIAINATGGGSSTDDSMIGTWVFNDEITLPTESIEISFISDGTEYAAMDVGSSGLYYSYEIGDFSEPAYDLLGNAWYFFDYQTFRILEEPPADVATWIKANAKKQGGSNSGSGGLEMPQIRFTSANGYAPEDVSTFLVDAEHPLKLTVEIVGGGALKVGDALQVCIRKRFNGSMRNGFKRKYKLQRFVEYIVTANDLDKKYLTVLVLGGGSSSTRGLFRDGNNAEKGLSPLYLRIRRPKGEMQNNNTRQTVDADFSNIVTIWKSYHRGEQLIRIY